MRSAVEVYQMCYYIHLLNVTVEPIRVIEDGALEMFSCLRLCNGWTIEPHEPCYIQNEMPSGWMVERMRYDDLANSHAHVAVETPHQSYSTITPLH